MDAFSDNTNVILFLGISESNEDRKTLVLTCYGLNAIYISPRVTFTSQYQLGRAYVTVRLS